MNVLQNVLEERAKVIQLQSANDFRAYRHLRGKHLARSRRELKIQVRPHKAKSSSSSQNKPKQVTSEEFQQNIAYGNVLIQNAERAWGSAMESKAVLDTKWRYDNASTRRHVISKLSKALKYANQLANADLDRIDNSSLSDNDKLQIYAYRALIEGSLRFEQKTWSKAVEAFAIARVIMAQVIGTELMKDVVAATVDPALSYAVYQSKKSRSVDVPTLAKQTAASVKSGPVVDLIKKTDASALEINSSRQDPSAQLGPITWRSHTAKVSNPDLASAIISAQEKEDEAAAQQKNRVTQFDVVLEGWQDALDIVNEAIHELENSADRAHDESSQQQYIVQTYISWRLLFTRIQRDLLLITQLRREADKKTSGRMLEHYRDLVRIYDTILQSTSLLKQLPGVTQDEELGVTLENMERYFKALRTGLVAKSYGLASNGNKLYSLALYKRSVEILQPALESGISADLPANVVEGKDLTNLNEELSDQLSRSHGLAVLSNVLSESSSNEQTSATRAAVIDSLDKYATGTPEQVLANLVDFEPKLRPVPVKPAYFDIAFNYIQYDEQVKQQVMSAGGDVSNSELGDKKQQNQEQGQKRGLFGLWR